MIDEFIRILKHEIRKDFKREKTQYRIFKAIERTKNRMIKNGT